MNLILFGFKGSGKTHFGKLLALEMNRPFIDTDDLIVKLHGKSCRQLYQELGEEKFRQIETTAITSLHHIENSIIALGGGAVLKKENVEFLQTIGALIYLKASLQKIRPRILKGEIPVIFKGEDPEDALHAMFHEREPVYLSIPAQAIDTDLLDEPAILDILRKLICPCRSRGP